MIKNGWQDFIVVGRFNTPFNENYYQGGEKFFWLKKALLTSC